MKQIIQSNDNINNNNNNNNDNNNNNNNGHCVVAQLVEWQLPTPESRGSNPVIGQFYLLSTVSKDENKIKEAVICPIQFRVIVVDFSRNKNANRF